MQAVTIQRLRWHVVPIVFCLIGTLGQLATSEERTREALLFEHVTVTLGDPALGQRLSDATILIVNGMIVAVRTNGESSTDIPPQTRRIDATGLHAVPAFIDAYTSLALAATPASRNQDRDPDFTTGPTPRSRPALRSGMTPEQNAADLLETDVTVTKAHRQAGFASAHVVPPSGYLSGFGAVISLSGQPLRDRVLHEHTGIGASFKASHSGYPRSLMGKIAHLRQTLLDADHHRRWKTFHSRHPLGERRPPRDTSLDALASVLDGDIPLFFAADSVNEMNRALRLAREFQIKTVLTGATDAARILDKLEKLGTQLVLIPDGAEKPARDLELGAPPVRVQDRKEARWRERVGTARELAKRSMRFAFGTGSSKDPARLLKSIRIAMTEGLEPAVALRALTLGAAELLGLGSELGSIDSGKIASITFLDAPFANDKAHVRYLVSDGVLFEFDAAEEASENKESKDKSPDESVTPEPVNSDPIKSDKPAPATPADLPGHLLTPCELDEDRRPTLQSNGNLLIRDAHVLTMAGTELPRASIRVRNGKITAIDVDLSPEEHEAVIDADGWFVMPGIIDCHSHMAVQGGLNEFSDSVTCQVRIADVVHPQDVAIYRAVAGGTTMAHILHGSANTIGGQCHLLRLKYGREADEMRVDFAPPTVKFALGENVKQSNFPRSRGKRFPVTRMGVEATLRRSFTAARDYERQWKTHATRVARGIPSLEPRRDLRLEAVLAVLEGDILVHSHCYRSDEIIMLLGIAEEFGFRISTLQHVLEGYKVMPEIAAHGAAASTFSDWWAYKIEAFDAIPHNASVMQHTGISVSLNSDSDELVRHLFHESAKACKYGGATEEDALRMITLEPARQLRIDHRVGTIEVGRDADLAIFDAHPLSVYARCRYTIIEGEIYFEMSGERVNPMAGRAMAPPEDFLPEPVEEHPNGIYAIRGARVVTVDSLPIPHGIVLLSKGKIAAVGTSETVTIPDGAMVIDAEGLEVYPGLIDAGTDLGVTEIGAVQGTVDLGETGKAQPDLRMAVAIHAHSELIPVARAGGITNAAIFNQGSLIAGRPALIRLQADSTPAAIARDELGMQVDLIRVTKDDEKAVEKSLVLWFDKAREAAKRQTDNAEPVSDPRVQALIPCVERRLPVFFTADRESEIRLAIKLADLLEVRAIVRGGRDAWKVAPLLAEKNIPVIVGPVLSLPFKSHDPFDAPYRNPGRLHAAGVPIAFQSTDGSFSRNLSDNAGAAVAYGLPHATAIRALTLGAAEILGVSDQLGSITPGKTGNLIITNGDPLEIRTQVRHVFIEGRPVSLETRHTRLYRQFRHRVPPRRLKNF